MTNPNERLYPDDVKNVLKAKEIAERLVCGEAHQERLARLILDWRPYHMLLEFERGYRDMAAGIYDGGFDGLEGQAWDRGAQTQRHFANGKDPLTRDEVVHDHELAMYRRLAVEFQPVA